MMKIQTKLSDSIKKESPCIVNLVNGFAVAWYVSKIHKRISPDLGQRFPNSRSSVSHIFFVSQLHTGTVKGDLQHGPGDGRLQLQRANNTKKKKEDGWRKHRSAFVLRRAGTFSEIRLSSGGAIHLLVVSVVAHTRLGLRLIRADGIDGWGFIRYFNVVDRAKVIIICRYRYLLEMYFGSVFRKRGWH